MVKQARILVVDDEQDMCKVFHTLLEREGYEVESAYSGDMALAQMADHPFDLVLCDIKMPGIDGIELLQRIKEENDNTVVILVTAFASLDTAIHAAKYQADGYLTKPLVSRHHLLEVVERSLTEDEL